MTLEAFLENNDTVTKINFENLVQLLRNNNSQYRKYSGDEETIYLKNFLIECSDDEFISFSDRITLSLRLEFYECFFNSKNTVFISGMICKNFVTFKNCIFPNGFYMYEGMFSKKLEIAGCSSKDFHITGGEFEEVNLYNSKASKIWISGGKFKELNINNWLPGDISKEITVINNDNELGNINIENQILSKLYLGGTNVTNTYTFKGLKCDNVSIIEFINTGSLNFYGIEPNMANSADNYFQLINSNLNKAQFYRAKFSDYYEFIIIDSYIIDSLFISCRWKNNIRSLRGPGYESFKATLANNRKIEPSERYGIKEAYRQLKQSMNKHSDKIQEHIFYSKEMDLHNQLLKWSPPWRNTFWDKLILSFSKIFSDYGQSFIKPLFFLLLVHLIMFILAVSLNGLAPLHISFANPTAQGFKTAFENYFIYINPLRKLETSLSGYLILLDLLMRVWSSYMIFNIIRASRRFISQ